MVGSLLGSLSVFSPHFFEFFGVGVLGIFLVIVGEVLCFGGVRVFVVLSSPISHNSSHFRGKSQTPLTGRPRTVVAKLTKILTEVFGKLVTNLGSKEDG